MFRFEEDLKLMGKEGKDRKGNPRVFWKWKEEGKGDGWIGIQGKEGRGKSMILILISKSR